MLVRTGTTEDEKHSIQQRITFLLMTHQPAKCVAKNEVKAIKELRTDNRIIIPPADDERSTVFMNREDYDKKAKALIDDRESYRQAQNSEAKAVSNQLKKLVAEFKR
ncbi:unnamed protein product [Dibothriocephalus latus]|uniref:Uncharacterized protein n=1 Tax=Dibothriocephalus latus TaxID=60516 RepID=A0A3P6UIF3_DIBLA|nr:unnamed protein product [Dibothriocephalus latus]